MPLIYPALSIECIEMMTTSERKNNRGKIQIMGDVLALATSGIKKTHIMYRANLSYEQVYLYLGDLIGKRLIVQDVSPDGVVYRTTEKGREFLLHYTRLVEFLEEEEAKQDPEVELSSPYISSRAWIR
jgi:predicted transcriptional regulator